MTENAKKEAIKDETAAVFLCLLKLEAEGLAPLYLVDNTEPVTSNGIEYTPCAFKYVLPSQNDEGASKACKIEIDNVDRRIGETVSRTINIKVTATVSIIMAQTPNITEEGPFRFILRNINISKETVSGELYDFYIYDRNLPGMRYVPQDFPGLFA